MQFQIDNPVDAGLRRKLRIGLGSRVGRRSGTKSRRVRAAGKRPEKPRVRLARAIRTYVAEQAAAEQGAA